MTIVLLQHQATLLAGSGDSYPPDAPLWDGEIGARELDDDFDWKD